MFALASEMHKSKGVVWAGATLLLRVYDVEFSFFAAFNFVVFSEFSYSHCITKKGLSIFSALHFGHLLGVRILLLSLNSKLHLLHLAGIIRNFFGVFMLSFTCSRSSSI